MTNSNMSLQFNFSSVWFEQITPSAAKGKSEIELIANLTAFSSAGADEVTVINDSDNTT